MPEPPLEHHEKSIAATVMSGLERTFFAIGSALLVAWGAEMLGSIIYSRAALARFDVNQAMVAGNRSPARRNMESGSEAGIASWPIRQIQSYRHSLLQKIDAPLAVLSIPRIHLEVPVFNGTDGATLNRGVGRIAGTAQVGEGGNLAIAGHRDRFFRGLKDLTKGDLIELSRPGHTDFYVIDEIKIVRPEDVSVLEPTTVPSLTLITCFPFYFVGSAPQRYVVRASLRESSQLGESECKNSISPGK